MPSKIKKAIMGVIAVFALLVIVSLLTSPDPEGQKTNSENSGAGENQANNPTAPVNTAPPPVPTFQTNEKQFEVIEARQDGTYRVRDLAANQEVELFIPSDANITAGSRGAIEVGTPITATRYLEAANGIVATELSVSTVQ